MVTLIEDTNVSDANIVLLLNQGLYEIALAHPWPWLQETATVSLTADTRTVALPSDFNYMLALVDDDNDKRLEYISPESFFAMYGNDTGNTSATPEFYTIFENLIHFHPIPSATDTARYTAYYYESVTTMSAGTSTPQFNAAFHYILVEYAKWKLYEREEYYSQSERAFVQFSRYLDQMIAYYNRQVTWSPYISGDGVFNGGFYDQNLRWMWEV